MVAAAVGPQSVPMAVTAFLKTRITPEMKSRVAQVVASEFLSEAVWLRRIVAKELHARWPELRQAGVPGEPLVAAASRRRGGSRSPARGSRLSVRLRREDRLLLDERAHARSLASATYVSVLVRAHLRALTPLPREELAALKRAISELGAIGRNLNQIARAANQGAQISAPGREEFRGMLKICEALRDHTKGLIKTNTATWATGYAEDPAETR